MIYYKSRYLSEKLFIKLAKWKRWSREFLDPDPLGGIQSGVARQFNLRDAFKVYLGGFLVSELKFTIPEAMTILTDLSPWLKESGFFSIESQLRSSGRNWMHDHHIYIYFIEQSRFEYAVRTIVPDSHAGDAKTALKETFFLTLIGAETDPLTTGACPSADVIAITTLYRNFRRQIG